MAWHLRSPFLKWKRTSTRQADCRLALHVTKPRGDSRLLEAFNAGDTQSLRRLHTDDAIIRGVLGWGTIDQALAIWQMLHDALAIELTIEALIEAGDTVAVRYTERGRSVGEFRGQQPTGKTYELVAIEWFEMHEGRIHRRWGARDSAAQMKQLGLEPL